MQLHIFMYTLICLTFDWERKELGKMQEEIVLQKSFQWKKKGGQADVMDGFKHCHFQEAQL